MAVTKYLDYDGLLYFWTLIKGKLALKADKATTLSGYGITDSYTKSEVDAKLASGVNYRGSVATYNDLPASPEVGDMYNVTATDENYIWAGASGNVAAHWDPIGALVNIAAISNSEIDTVVAS